MGLCDDETLQMYVEESIDHLADIEQDLLAIEHAGAELDDELVNKVFRAAHSVKGGAGFLGLHTVNELAHKLENVLGMIRSRDIVPNADIVNVLLQGFDKLQELIDDVEGSNQIDIGEHTAALSGLTSALLPPDRKDSVAELLCVSLLDDRASFTVTAFELSEARKGGKQLYIFEYDLVRDVDRRGITPLKLLEELEDGGIILDCKVDLHAVGTLESAAPSNVLPFFVLFATIIEPDIAQSVFELPAPQVHVIADSQICPAAAEETATPPATADPGGTAVAPGLSTPDLAGAAATATATKPDAGPGPQPEASPSPADSKRTGKKTETNLRVSVRLLDSLMTLAGELVLGRNQLLQAVGEGDRRSLETVTQRMDLITSELQEAIMLTRMQPVGNIFNKFPRVIRDLSNKLGKQVQLVLEGTEVELDKTIIEGLSDPLTHLVRNAVDHGIETPERRRAAGKPPQGVVALKAFHEAGQVNIEIRDDGKGLDGEKLGEAAIEKGLLSREQVKAMSGKERCNLIFLPGFSTAAEVTDVSGRGVGMDVVRTNLDKLGGIVDLESEVGRGTVIHIKLPLTLAIIPSQIVVCGGQRFAIPQVNMDELLRIPAAQVKHRVERVGDAEVVRLRDQLLPLVQLSDVLGLQRFYADPGDGTRKTDRRRCVVDRRSPHNPAFYAPSQTGGAPLADANPPPQAPQRSGSDRRCEPSSAVNLVVASTGSFRYGLVVDELHDAEEIVVKPLGRHLKKCIGYAGATIMGNGRVALILDVAGLAQLADLNSVAGTDRAAEVAREEESQRRQQQDSLLLFHNAASEQFALPLDLVARIEKIHDSNLEIVAGRRVMQYKGGLLPLHAIEDVAEVHARDPHGEAVVLVVTGPEGEVGILATGPVDSYEGDVTIDHHALVQRGIAGSAIIAGKATPVLDVWKIIGLSQGPARRSAATSLGTQGGDGPTLLLAEDSAFFRDQVAGVLRGEGYRVLAAEDGAAAWQLLQQHADEVALVLTDIEMPNLDGLGLTRKIRAEARFADLAVFALTTLADDRDIQRGLEAGVTEYHIKLDAETLLTALRKALAPET